MLNIVKEALHSAYLCMKIPSNHGVISVYGSLKDERRVEGTQQEPKILYNIEEDETQAQASEKQVKEKESSVDQPKSVLLCEDVVDQRVLFGNQLTSEQESNLKKFLFDNKDVFAWSANDLCGVDRSIIEHSLSVDPSSRPRKQKLRKMSEDKAEVKIFLNSRVIREVAYPKWLANIVMDKKSNGKCRMCIDFIDLNKACLKDEFPLPRIDSLVDAANTSELMGLSDCYLGYQEIWMKKEDEPKTSFITPSGTYCNLWMPKGLKNADGSFSRMMAKVLSTQLGRNVLTYVDDIIVRSTKQQSHILDL
jgi:hypothetical protein